MLVVGIFDVNCFQLYNYKKASKVKEKCLASVGRYWGPERNPPSNNWVCALLVTGPCENTEAALQEQVPQICLLIQSGFQMSLFKPKRLIKIK